MAYLQNYATNKLCIEKQQIKNKSNLFDIDKHWPTLARSSKSVPT